MAAPRHLIRRGSPTLGGKGRRELRKSTRSTHKTFGGKQSDETLLPNGRLQVFGGPCEEGAKTVRAIHLQRHGRKGAPREDTRVFRHEETRLTAVRTEGPLLKRAGREACTRSRASPTSPVVACGLATPRQNTSSAFFSKLCLSLGCLGHRCFGRKSRDRNEFVNWSSQRTLRLTEAQ